MQKGDKQWVHQVFNDYSSDLTRYAMSILGDPELAKDSVQETFLRLCKEDEKKIRPKLRPWLFRVCRSRAIDLCRREQKKGSNMNIESLSEQSAPEPTPLAQAEQAESNAGIMKLVRGLPETQQEVLRLKFQQSLSYKEIAEVTGMTVSNVGVLLHTAMKQLRNEVCELG